MREASRHRTAPKVTRTSDTTGVERIASVTGRTSPKLPDAVALFLGRRAGWAVAWMSGTVVAAL